MLIVLSGKVIGIRFYFSAYCKNLLNICDLADIERKLQLYKQMFYCNSSGDRDPNYIKCESLMIELIAGGLSWQQQDYVMSQLRPNSWREVSQRAIVYRSRILLRSHLISLSPTCQFTPTPCFPTTFSDHSSDFSFVQRQVK